MRAGSLSLVVGLCSALPFNAHAQATSPDTAEVRTAATVRRGLRPDRAAVTFRFSADGATPAQAGERVAARTDSLRRALASLGVPRDSIVTGTAWYWWPKRIEVVTGQRRIPGRNPNSYMLAVDTVVRAGGSWEVRPVIDSTYRSHEVVEVRTDPGTVGRVIDVALLHRITDISGVRFAATGAHDAHLEALGEATRRAHDQAQAIAEANGGRLGRVLELGSQPSSPESPWARVDGAFQGGRLEGGTPTEVTPPSVQVTVTVHGRWQLLPR